MTGLRGDEEDVIGVVGAGLMGAGIAALICASKIPVKVYDVDSSQLESLQGRIDSVVAELVRYELADNGADRYWSSYLNVIKSLSDFKDCSLVVEAVVEKEAVKKQVYEGLEGALAQDAIIASNTSNIVPSALVDGMREPERFLVAHFWNPPHAVPLVEIIPSEKTSPQVVDRTVTLIKRIGNEPVVLSKEVAGFVGNRLQYALLREALWIVEQGIATPEEVDRVMTLSLGRRYASVGPFATADLGGLDTFLMISKQLMPKLASGTECLDLMENIVAAGNTGSKSGQGFLTWSDSLRKETVVARNEDLLKRKRRAKH